MSQHVETMRAALHEIGERDLAAAVVKSERPGSDYATFLMDRRSQTVLIRASIIAKIALEGAASPELCFVHNVMWKTGTTQPIEWDQCAHVAAWQMLHDPTTVCANTLRRP